jgi:hypothetical protein
MSALLKAHIEKLLGDAFPEYEDIGQFFEPIALRKKQNLLEEGKICKSNYFVVEGCLRMFFVNEKGVEQTVQFALEHWWLNRLCFCADASIDVDIIKRAIRVYFITRFGCYLPALYTCIYPVRYFSFLAAPMKRKAT